MNNDTGQRSGKRQIRGGRPQVRRVLNKSTLAVTRFSPQIKSVYQRLLVDGKAKEVALVAAMHELLTIVNTLIMKDQLWQTDESNERVSHA